MWSGAARRPWGRSMEPSFPRRQAARCRSCPTQPCGCCRTIHDHYPKAWCRYGFVDAFNPLTDWYDTDVIGIDTGITMLMAENARTGFVWDTFMKNPEAQRGMADARASRPTRPHRASSACSSRPAARRARDPHSLRNERSTGIRSATHNGHPRIAVHRMRSEQLMSRRPQSAIVAVCLGSRSAPLHLADSTSLRACSACHA